MLINTYLDTEDFVHLYYSEDDPPAAATQGCGAGARMASKYTARPPTPDYAQVSRNMTERERARAPPPPEPPPHRVRAADMYPRQRTHYDEPDLDVPFATICGEFVQWVGRTADGGTVAMSNYRFHAQPRRRSGPGTSVPLRVIDTVEVRDIIHLHILCKDGRTLKCTFGGGGTCAEWWRRLSGALSPLSCAEDTFAAAYAAWAREQPPASIHRALVAASHSAQTTQTRRHWFDNEVERLGFTARGAWRVTSVNSDYKLCPSYPPLLVVPASFGDEDLDSVARFRAMRRVPAVVWRHRGNGAVIARASQPEVGWLGWRSSEDERLLAAFVAACAQDRGVQPDSTARQQVKLLIIDARSYASAVTNRARGGGCECAQYYPQCDIQFMCLPNIHHVRRSFQQLRQLVGEPADQPNWHGGLERTLWLQYVSGLGRAAALAARAVLAGRPVLVHCSDGWDRTPQIVAAAQLILDPYYRTCQGFRVLIEREWLDFGHKFADRCGHQFCPEEPNEKSPIFLQWLDLVHQIMIQYPCSFEFSEAYLIKLITHVYSCMFGTFLCNGPKERVDGRVPETTAQVWTLLEGPAYRNHLYCPPTGEPVLWPEYNMRSLQFWSALMVGPRADLDDDCDVEVAAARAHRHPPAHRHHQTHHPHHNGLMTKTRSCDNLLNEGERRTAQRRCSDPSLAPDVMKLTSMLSGAASGSCSSLSGSARGGLTDSYVDDMAPPAPASPATPSAPDTPTSPTALDCPTAPDCPTASDSPDTTDTADLEPATDQVDGLHVNHFEHGPDLVSTSSSLERELAASQMVRSDRTLVDHTLVEAPRDDRLYLDDVAAIAEAINCDVQAAREAASGRMRHVSITWRSVSESSHQTDSSTGFDLTEMGPRMRNDSATVPTSVHNGTDNHNHNSTAGDEANHNVSLAALTNHNRMEDGVQGNGDVHNGGEIDDLTAKLLADELVICDNGAGSSSASSDSEEEEPPVEGELGEEGEEGARRRGGARGGARARGASQHTLCPDSPSLCRCCHRGACARAEEAGEATAACMCGGATAAPHARDPLDGLPPAPEPLQARLHTIILHQKMALEQMSRELRMARVALQQRLASPPPVATAPARPTDTQGGASSSRSSSSASGSGSEVEVGEEARGAVWLPDSAARRCQYCRNQFWLARRRHHCRKCGGIFCGSCSEVGALVEWPAVRVCRLCRTHR